MEIIAERLSREVALLLEMTNIEFYHGMKMENIVSFHDEFKERDIANDICILLAKYICYKQIVERMVNSLHQQEVLLEKICGYNAHYQLKKKHYKRKKMKEYCADLRKKRNNLAHEILERGIDEWIEQYKNVDDEYMRIQNIYTEQSMHFYNRIGLILENAADFLKEGKNYYKDMSVIRECALDIQKNAHKNKDDAQIIIDIANLYQIYEMLRGFCCFGERKGLKLKEELYFYEHLEMKSVYQYEFRGYK